MLTSSHRISVVFYVYQDLKAGDSAVSASFVQHWNQAVLYQRATSSLVVAVELRGS